MACLSDMAFKMPSLFPQMSLTAQHCLRAEYLFTPPARLGGAKGTVSCGSSPGSPWKRRFSSPLSSGLVVVSGRGEMLLMQWGFLSPDKTTEVNTQNKNAQFFKIGHMYKSKKKKKNLKTVVISFYKYSGNSLSWNSLIQRKCYHNSILLLFLLLLAAIEFISH